MDTIKQIHTIEKKLRSRMLDRKDNKDCFFECVIANIAYELPNNMFMRWYIEAVDDAETIELLYQLVQLLKYRGFKKELKALVNDMIRSKLNMVRHVNEKALINLANCDTVNWSWIKANADFLNRRWRKFALLFLVWGSTPKDTKAMKLMVKRYNALPKAIPGWGESLAKIIGINQKISAEKEVKIMRLIRLEAKQTSIN